MNNLNDEIRDAITNHAPKIILDLFETSCILEMMPEREYKALAFIIKAYIIAMLDGNETTLAAIYNSSRTLMLSLAQLEDPLDETFLDSVSSH